MLQRAKDIAEAFARMDAERPILIYWWSKEDMEWMAEDDELPELTDKQFKVIADSVNNKDLDNEIYAELCAGYAEINDDCKCVETQPLFKCLHCRAKEGGES